MRCVTALISCSGSPYTLAISLMAARGAKPDMIGNHRGPGRPVLLEDIIEDAVPFVPGEIDVDVGRIRTPFVEEAFEKEIVRDRLHVGDPEAVRNQARGRGSTAARSRRLPDNVPHDQEIGGRTLCP